MPTSRVSRRTSRSTINDCSPVISISSKYLPTANTLVPPLGRRVVDREKRRDLGPSLAVTLDVVDVCVARKCAERLGMQRDIREQSPVFVLVDVEPVLVLAHFHAVIADPVCEFRGKEFEVSVEILGIEPKAGPVNQPGNLFVGDRHGGGI